MKNGTGHNFVKFLEERKQKSILAGTTLSFISRKISDPKSLLGKLFVGLGVVDTTYIKGLERSYERHFSTHILDVNPRPIVYALVNKIEKYYKANMDTWNETTTNIQGKYKQETPGSIDEIHEVLSRLEQIGLNNAPAELEHLYKEVLPQQVLATWREQITQLQRLYEKSSISRRSELLKELEQSLQGLNSHERDYVRNAQNLNRQQENVKNIIHNIQDQSLPNILTGIINETNRRFSRGEFRNIRRPGVTDELREDEWMCREACDAMRKPGYYEDLRKKIAERVESLQKGLDNILFHNGRPWVLLLILESGGLMSHIAAMKNNRRIVFHTSMNKSMHMGYGPDGIHAYETILNNEGYYELRSTGRMIPWEEYLINPDPKVVNEKLKTSFNKPPGMECYQILFSEGWIYYPHEGWAIAIPKWELLQRGYQESNPHNGLHLFAPEYTGDGDMKTVEKEGKKTIDLREGAEIPLNSDLPHAIVVSESFWEQWEERIRSALARRGMSETEIDAYLKNHILEVTDEEFAKDPDQIVKKHFIDKGYPTPHWPCIRRFSGNYGEGAAGSVYPLFRYIEPGQSRTKQSPQNM